MQTFLFLLHVHLKEIKFTLFLCLWEAIDYCHQHAPVRLYLLECNCKLYSLGGLQVIGRKVNPEASYIDIEKKPIKRNTISPSSGDSSVAKFAQLLNQERNPTLQPPNVMNQTSLKGEAKTREEDYPGLVKPPLLPGMPAPQVFLSIFFSFS